MTSLLEACKKGNFEDVKTLIENGADVNQINKSGETALYIAVKSESLDLVKYLVEKNANVNGFVRVKRQVFEIEKSLCSLCSEVCARVLHIAIKTCSIDVVKFLVENGADVSYVNDAKEISYLHFAIVDGSLEIVKYLVEIGAHVNYNHCCIGSPLHLAAVHGSLSIVKYLVERGANVNCEHKEKGTALHVAVKCGSFEFVQYFVEHGADVNYENEEKGTALHVAVRCGSLEIVKHLVERGADVNYEHKQEGPLLYAAAKHSTDVLEYLFEHVDNGLKRVAALYLAIQSGSLENVKRVFHERGFPNCTTSNDHFAFCYAVERGSLEIVKYLVEHGADVNFEHKWKGTVLHVAVRCGCLEIVKYLVAHGADVNHEHKRKGTALHVAVRRQRSLETVECLVHHGADVNAILQWNETALHKALKHRSLEAVKCLVEHGADVNRENRNYRTPLRTAVSSGSLEIVKLLLEHGAEATNGDKDFDYSLICLACEKGDKSFVDYLLRSGIVKNLDKRSGYKSSPLSIACSKGHTEIVQILLNYKANVEKEGKLECENDQILNILQLELNKSVKHRDKVKMLRSMDDENLLKVTLPLRYFVPNPSLSIGVSSATVVYVGIMEDESEVAVKRIFAQSCSEAAENERNILSLIDTRKSPFIVNYRHFFRDDTFMYLILDLCEETLREFVHSQTIEYLQQRGPRMIKQILMGLEFLHELGILHRDLKPMNVLVDVDGLMKLADFGISRVLSEDETTHYTDPNGTVGWMAAEVIKAIKHKDACPYKKKSDVQVAGMIAYFILTKGKHPFGDHLDRMKNIVKGKPVTLNELDDSSARQFVKWMISHKLKDRPYAHETLEHHFLQRMVDEAFEATLQRPQIVRI